MNSFERVLVLSPHTDDGELGCGGSIARLVEEGKQVYYVAFSIAEKSVPAGMPRNILEKEVKEATSRLGIPDRNLRIYKFEVRKLNYSRQDILEELVEINRELNPDVVFLPSPNDLHQDHHTVAMEGIRAFKAKTILGYELPWNNLTFKNQFFIKLEWHHLEKKIEAVRAYESQKHRSYTDEKFLTGLARVRGEQIGVEYAEVFEVIRCVL